MIRSLSFGSYICDFFGVLTLELPTHTNLY